MLAPVTLLSRTLLTSIVATAALASAVPASASTLADPAARRLDSITLEGHGYGHGHGLSQYGAEGAAREGLSTGQILRFYYPGTKVGRLGGTVRVLLTDLDDRLVVKAQSSLTVAKVGSGRHRTRAIDAKATWWRVVPDGTTNRVERRRGGSWKLWRSVAGDVEFAADAPLTVKTADGEVQYRGTLRSVRSEATPEGREIVNHVSLENYLRGVVPREVPALWHGAAVRAQAIAARTYAAFERADARGAAYDLCDTAACQVYGGASAEHPASDAAVKATAGQVLTEGGEPIFAQFSASNGGWTAAGDYDYLPAQEDPYDGWSGNPYTDWTATLTAADIEAQWPAIGDLTGITIDQRDGNGEWGGRVLSMTIAGTAGSVVVSGATFRTRFGLRETWFQLA
ncbi:hypothetical protein GCM10022215_11280 [Nocardioides fonticola]|uniref:Sporulation stage II protein D amidase enhancer LytB N-terminal domain-containing protein n=1 Tax=Nocardioides fonticola TaxID=450363 RepID=A0ABP7XEY1_9ACTN